jgi:hypothetical protein
MCKCGSDYQMDTLHIAYNNQHFLNQLNIHVVLEILNCNLKPKILNHL